MAEVGLDVAQLRQMMIEAARSAIVLQFRDMEQVGYFEATRASALYMLEHMLGAAVFRGEKYRRDGGRFDLLEFALKSAHVDPGLYLEFGVFKGDTLTFIADRIDTYVYGFDSFEGLPENWFYDVRKGYFDLGGNAPPIQARNQNIVLVKGLFDQSLPNFLEGISSSDLPVRFLHMDCDLYSSAREVLTRLKPRIVPGTVILFDEYMNYPGWQKHEFLAFQEFVTENGISYEYIGYAPTWFSAAVRITAVPGNSR